MSIIKARIKFLNWQIIPNGRSYMKKIVSDFISIIIGCTFMALGIVLFLLPNQLSSGGFSGIATVLYYLLKFPIGTVTLVLNIPFFIIALFKLR